MGDGGNGHEGSRVGVALGLPPPHPGTSLIESDSRDFMRDSMQDRILKFDMSNLKLGISGGHVLANCTLR